MTSFVYTKEKKNSGIRAGKKGGAKTCMKIFEQSGCYKRNWGKQCCLYEKVGKIPKVRGECILQLNSRAAAAAATTTICNEYLTFAVPSYLKFSHGKENCV